MFTWRVDATIMSNIMGHMHNTVCWESASLPSLKGNPSGKLLQFYEMKASWGGERGGNGGPRAMIWLDFQKVFDKVQHQSLLKHHQ